MPQNAGLVPTMVPLLNVSTRPYSLSDFDYALPTELIAQFPPTVRGASRLLDLLDVDSWADRSFSEFPSLLREGDVLVFNDTKVIPARLSGHKETGGAVEILVERILSSHTALAHVRASKPPKPGASIVVSDALKLHVQERRDALFLLRFPEEKSVLGWLAHCGELPLPPYITHAPTGEDAERYQTVYAQREGAVAAPTAGLHFTDEMLARIDAMGVTRAHVTLHVGAGTFQPVRSDDLSKHVMHSEWYEVSPQVAARVNDAKREGRRVIAVGTTALRAIESSAAKTGFCTYGAEDTQLFITPGYDFKVLDCLLTNFHLPKSTLMMLVSAFAGVESIRNAYAHAIANRYRFFSYGDAMFLRKRLP
jgi:S-adenosylmethionine:tRNA ribosyltransferase-isomerase